MIIGISGPIGSGKTTAAKYLSATWHLSYLRYSEVLQEMLRLKSADRNTLREAGCNIMAQGQQTALNEKLISLLEVDKDYVIDGLRHPIDFETLTKYSKGSFTLLFVETGQEIRWQRLKLRGEFNDWPDFQAADMHPVETHVSDLKNRAHRVVVNEGTPAELYEKLDTFFPDIGKAK